MPKRFLEWIKIKEKIHESNSIPPYVKEGSVWWCGIGENIGIEMNGKSEVFSRPVLIYKKLSNESCTIIPLTTKQKIGSWFVPVTLEGKKATLNMAQVRAVSTSRLYSKIGTLNTADMKNTSDLFIALYTWIEPKEEKDDDAQEKIFPPV
jgi:mRNA-degrading endonuclease toxin of MazEF toxin-antitoxin module